MTGPQTGAATSESLAGAGTGAVTGAVGPDHREPALPALLEFLAAERRRSARGAFSAGLLGIALGAVVTAAGGSLLQGGPTTDGADDPRLARLERQNAELAAQLRALVSGGRRDGSSVAAGDAVTRGPAAADDTALAGKPSGLTLDEDERARRVGSSEIARALERAKALPSISGAPPANAPPAIVPYAPSTEGDANATANATADGAAPPVPDGVAAPAPEAIVLAFNKLLKDCGLDAWSLMSAEPAPADHELHHVVLAHRAPNGTSNGSLAAERLVLERDAGSGAAAFVLTGAHGTEEGVDQAYPNAATRLEIPGLLPLDLIPAELAQLFGASHGGAIGTTARVDPGDPNQIVRAVNAVLTLDKGVAVRVRSCEKFADDKLEKAVIDLLFDDHGQARQTVFADKAWFELDSKRDYAELCCEGGDMVVDGSRRALFRGRLRWPIHATAPLQWRDMPTLKLVAGS